MPCLYFVEIPNVGHIDLANKSLGYRMKSLFAAQGCQPIGEAAFGCGLLNRNSIQGRMTLSSALSSGGG